MAIKEQIIKEKLENLGIFDFQGLYKFAHYWLKDEEGYGVTEEKYSEKVSGNAREISVKWKATKEVTDYFKIELSLEFEAKEMAEVEVEIDGEKKRMNKGKISIEIKGNLIKDHKNRWENGNFYIALRDIYDKYIIPGRIDELGKKVTSDVTSLKEEAKAFLELSAKR
ncbi:MAG: hypothetical protein AABW65_02430 [Nanoarchaeota archaeon]